MDRSLSPLIYAADFTGKSPTPARPAFRQVTARIAKFDEKWLQDAIERDPSIVIAPCEQAGLTQERWWFWSREFGVEVGNIDVLLLSETGRVAIVETKLSYNPEKRRSVLAQLLDYAVHLGEAESDDLPALPGGLPKDVRLSLGEVARRIQDDRDYLLIVAGDELDARAVKLGRSLLGDHLINQWELALVEVAVFENQGSEPGPRHLLVPHIRGAIQVELRQVVKVKVEGDRSKITMERVEPETTASGIQWTQQEFVDAVLANPDMKPAKSLALGLAGLAQGRPKVTVQLGRGKTPSALLKRNGCTLVEVYAGQGQIVFPKEPAGLEKALGGVAAARWVAGLSALLPTQLSMTRPTVLARQGQPLDGVLSLLDEVLVEADKWDS